MLAARLAATRVTRSVVAPTASSIVVACRPSARFLVSAGPASAHSRTRSVPLATSAATFRRPFSAGNPLPPPPSTDELHGSGFSSAEASEPLSTIDPSRATPPLPHHKEHGFEVYTSPFDRVVRSLKMVSLTSATLSLAATPFIIYGAGSTMPLGGRIGLGLTVGVFGVATTLFLNYFTRSYVVRIFAKRLTGADAQVDPAVRQSNDAEAIAAQEWLMTTQTLNHFGAPVYLKARHADMSPLHSKLFNNLRIDTPLTGKDEKPLKRDLFVHIDLFKHPLLTSILRKDTVVSLQPSAMQLAALTPEQREAALRQSQETKVSKTQLRKELEEEAAARRAKEAQDKKNEKRKKENATAAKKQ